MMKGLERTRWMVSLQPHLSRLSGSIANANSRRSASEMCRGRRKEEEGETIRCNQACTSSGSRSARCHRSARLHPAKIGAPSGLSLCPSQPPPPPPTGKAAHSAVFSTTYWTGRAPETICDWPTRKRTEFEGDDDRIMAVQDSLPTLCVWDDLRLVNTQRDEVRRRQPLLYRPPSRLAFGGSA